MPMNKTSTPKEKAVSANKKNQTNIGPSASSLEFLRIFARLYEPDAALQVKAQTWLN